MSKPDGDGGLYDADTRLFESGNFADATIVCGDRTWKVHKAILSSRCKWFKAAFCGNMAEATSGVVVLQDQDADLVDIMLRFIYDRGDEIDTLGEKLDGGKDTPALCVQLFRLADFFLLDELARRAKDSLEDFLNHRINSLDDNSSDLSKALAGVFESIRHAYKDSSTEPLREMLLTCLWMRKEKHFQIPETIDLLNEIPALGKDLMKVYLAVDPTTDRPGKQELPRALPVLEAVRPCYDVYVAGGPVHNGFQPQHIKAPCILRPRNLRNEPNDNPFEVVDATTDIVVDKLDWFTAGLVWSSIASMAGHERSNIVEITLEHTAEICHIRFVSAADARHYIETYINADAKIEKIKRHPSALERELRAAHDKAARAAKDAAS